MKRIFFVLTLAAALVFAQASDPALEGNWTVTGAEHGGRPMAGLTGGIMIVKADRFEIRTAGGSLLKGQLKLDTTKTPARMALLHDSGLRWEAIYEAKGEDFRLNYIDAAGTDKLPTEFKTAGDTEATLVVLKRAKP